MESQYKIFTEEEANKALSPRLKEYVYEVVTTKKGIFGRIVKRKK